MIHLDLQPEVEAQLAAEAAACGLPLPRYVEKIVAARPTDPALDESSQRLLDQAAEADPLEGIRQGLEQLRRGEGRPAREFFDELRREYALPR